MNDLPPGDAAAPCDQDRRRALLERLGVGFHDPALLTQALLHPSFAREEEADPLTANERLEFLGDAVVELAVSDYLFRRLPDRDEGGLTTTRSFVVRGGSLAAAAARLGLGEALALGRGQDTGGGRTNDSILACALEALLGAVYLDQGWDVARATALRLLAPEIDAALAARQRNFKGELQELTQERLRQRPSYRLAQLDGPSHQRRFAIEVWLGDEQVGRGEGGSKKQAEQAAAEQALRRLQREAKP